MQPALIVPVYDAFVIRLNILLLHFLVFILCNFREFSMFGC